MATEVSIKFRSEEIVPDVVDIAPEEFLSVTFQECKVEFGKELTPMQVKYPPSVEWNADSSSFYTLCMIDPDSISRKDPKLREVVHWLVTNIAGQNVSNGETLIEYLGSGPGIGSGLHRYVFLLYEQSNKMNFTEKHIGRRTQNERPHFSIQRFADKYGMGAPIAGNMYLAQYDDFVPELRAEYDD